MNGRRISNQRNTPIHAELDRTDAEINEYNRDGPITAGVCRQRRTWSGVAVWCLVTLFIDYVRGDCSGGVTVLTANETTQELTSPGYPFGYTNNLDCRWRFEAANSTHAVRINLKDVSIEYHADCVYDSAIAFDGYNSSSTHLGTFCGTSLPHYISTGQYLTLTFHSDYSLGGKGFKLQYYSGEYSSLQDPSNDDESLNLNAIIAGSVGGVVLLAIIIAVVFTYIQAKKAKEIRNGRVRTTNVMPYENPGEYAGPPAPPAYGELYASPMSPPPAYCEYDPNPNPSAPLPARAEFINPEAGEGLVSVTPIYASGQSDAIINTRFIRPLNVRHSSSQTPPSNQCITATIHTTGTPRTPRASSQNAGGPAGQTPRQGPHGGGAVAALQVLNPQGLRASSRAQPQADIGSLPNAVVTSENHSSGVGLRGAQIQPPVPASQTSAFSISNGNSAPQVMPTAHSE